jgi:hypothetical protein
MCVRSMALLLGAVGWLGLGCAGSDEPCECEDDDPCDDDVADDDDTGGQPDDDDTGGQPDDDDDTGLMSEEEFADAYEHAYCQRALECYDSVTLEALGWATVQDCLAFFEDATDDDDDGDCYYREEFAAGCLQEVANVNCDDFITGIWMDACLEVWHCP